MKINLLLVDAPFSFLDLLTMSKTKRGAKAQYKQVMSDKDILNLPVHEIVADDALIAFWVPSSKLQLGLDIMKKWGFTHKQTWIWVKIKNEPLIELRKIVNKLLKGNIKDNIIEIIDNIMNFDLNNSLKFYMGRTFRQTHEIALIGTRGKISKHLKNKSQLSVFLGKNPRHSEKPEALQDRLDIMFPDLTAKVELFARRDRPGWLCYGNECPSSYGQDIKDSIEIIKNL